MRCTYLGWAGVELEHDGATLVIDPLKDARAMFAALGDRAADVPQPELDRARAGALAGLVTHLHRDHADAAALRAALALRAPVFAPAASEGSMLADAGLLLARRELAGEGLEVREVNPWETAEIGPFRVTALPAADGTGDPQVSWAVEAGGRRIVHGGDTMFHGWWWRAAIVAGPFDAAFLPINGAVLDFPHRRPASSLPAAMTAEEAVQAALSLGARQAVPIHFGAFDVDPFYRSAADAPRRFAEAAAVAGLPTSPLTVGESLTL